MTAFQPRIGWLTFAVLLRLRTLETTHVYGPHSCLSLRALGREWGECEWTARDQWGVSA